MVSEDVKAYISSLSDLTFNSKPLINMLTMLADENVPHASEIVEVVETHLNKVQADVKLPILYLIDCIVKNVGDPYTQLFSQNIVSTFCSVFRVVDEKTRAEMFKLRQTWNDVFSIKKLYAIDVQINLVDPAWPVTAPPPPNSSIHLNPKFLKNTNAAISKSKAGGATPAAPVIGDNAALDMQQQLIQKQKELLELQQKKLELELLQTQVKLQESFKQGGKGIQQAPGRPQNVLLKPEVAKQLAQPVSKSADVDPKQADVMNSTSTMNHRLQTTGSSQNIRIAPVNSSLINASRPSRDPRLLRQQQRQQKSGGETSNSTEAKSHSEMNSKMNNRHTNRNLVRVTVNNNRDSKIDDETDLVRQKLLKSVARNRQAAKNKLKKDGLSDDGKSLSSKSSTSSLESPTKKLDKSPTKLSSRNKLKDRNSSEKFSKREQDLKRMKLDTSPTKVPFKSVKGSPKSRNYVRRTRSPSFSPELQDSDMRNTKQANEQHTDVSDKSIIPPPPSLDSNGNQEKDVDFRQLPQPSVVSKKRPSIESLDAPNSKKTKTQFDILFGNEDTDLRMLNTPENVQPVLEKAKPVTVPQVERPKTPPPPIISEADVVEIRSPKKSSLDEVRAKLANATSSKEKILPKIGKKPQNEASPELNTRVLSDRDQVTSTSEMKEKIIISPDDEQMIRSGIMTNPKGKQLIKKIMTQLENQKLREAKKKDSEESLGNISLQAISDDELEEDFKEEAKANNEVNSINSKPLYPDPRMHPVMPHTFNDDGFKNFGWDPRRPNWRGGRGRRPWDHHPGLHPRPGFRPWGPHPMNNWRPMMPNFIRPPVLEVISTSPNPDMNSSPIEIDERKSPDTSSDIQIYSPSQEEIKSINIDGLPRDIRYYDERAVVFMNWDDPREISFQSGTRRVTFDDKDSYLLNFGDPYQELTIGNKVHKVRLGGPSREIFIDSTPYECYFGGPGISVNLGDRLVSVKLEGPPPQVKIGDTRTDLVGGKISLIIDAVNIIPIYLDARVQKFLKHGQEISLQFVDGLRSVLIDGEKFEVKFGALPKPVMLKGMKHYIRFSILPRHLTPGKVRIKGLETDDLETSSPRQADIDPNEPALPVPIRKLKQAEHSPDNSNSSQFFQNIQQQSLSNLDFLSNVITSSVDPDSKAGGYQVQNADQSNSQEGKHPKQPGHPTNFLNINELFQKLVATGIVTTGKTTANESNKPNNKVFKEKPRNHTPPKTIVSFDKPESLKTRQPHLYHGLYMGMQCSSCGMRFPPEQTTYYSQHLDWHFRQNRKGKKNARVASSRRWYYSKSDWQNYEEIEDIEEREKNFFDQQQSQVESSAETAQEPIDVPSVTADPELQDICEICGDKFETFFNEEKEEWHFRNAVRDDDKTFHPSCYDDYQTSLANQSLEESLPVETIPGISIVVLDEEDEDKLKEDDEVIIDESDESKHGEEDVKEETTAPPPVEEYIDEDDDVIIHEEKIEKIILDDDDIREEDRNEPNVTPIIYRPSIKAEPDDGFMEVGDSLVMIGSDGPIKIKTEPVDPDDSAQAENIKDVIGDETSDGQDDSVIEIESEDPKPPEEPEEEEEVVNNTAIVSSIDGNVVEMDSGVSLASATGVCGKIKINLSKPLPVITSKENNKDFCSESEPVPSEPTTVDPSQPLPPGEEPVLLNLKPGLQGVELKKMAAVQKGSELTGLCSIM